MAVIPLEHTDKIPRPRNTSERNTMPPVLSRKIKAKILSTRVGEVDFFFVLPFQVRIGRTWWPHCPLKLPQER